MRKLYSHPLSVHAHKARMLLSFLGLEYEEIVVDVVAGAQNDPTFRAINPRGKVPVLVDGEVTLYDSHAILVYLARQYGDDQWLPAGAADQGLIMQWISFSANELHHGPYMARLNALLGLGMSSEALEGPSKASLKLLDDRLTDREWLELGRPTIADVACFPAVALAPEGNLPLDDYKNALAWIERVKGLPNFASMAGM